MISDEEGNVRSLRRVENHISYLNKGWGIL